MDIVKNLCSEPKILLAIIIVFVALIIYAIYKYYQVVSAFLYGMWYGDEEFCDKANISNIYFYVGTVDKKKGSRSGYLLIYDEDEVIDNTRLSIDFGLSSVTMKRHTVPTDKTAVTMPETLSYDIDLARGTMKLYDASDKKVYACLIKDNVMTKYLDAEIAEDVKREADVKE